MINLEFNSSTYGKIIVTNNFRDKRIDRSWYGKILNTNPVWRSMNISEIIGKKHDEQVILYGCVKSESFQTIMYKRFIVYPNIIYPEYKAGYMWSNNVNPLFQGKQEVADRIFWNLLA